MCARPGQLPDPRVGGLMAIDTAGRTEGPWNFRGITIHCMDQLPEGLSTHFYTVYEEAFAPLRSLAPGRQVLTREEFHDEMVDSRVWKYVAGDSHDNPLGLTTLTSDLRTVPWISPEYYQLHYPTQWANDAVFYLNFSLVSPHARHQQILFAMLRAATNRVAACGGVCAYDVCGVNNTGLGPDRVQRMLHRLGHIVVDNLDVQSYYAARFV